MPAPHQPPKNFVISGATGFVGQHLLQHLLEKTDANLKLLVRDPDKLSPTIRNHPRIKIYQVSDLSAAASRPSIIAACQNADAAFHLAARAHVMRENVKDPAAAYKQQNLDATRIFAECFAEAGKGRFVFLSSVKVHGESTESLGRPFQENDPLLGSDAYAVSKRDAETALHELRRSKGLDFVIVRPPLVYGPGVKANFRALIKLVKSGVPLPLGGVQNQRSLIYVANLVDALLTCASHPRAAAETFLVRDAHDVSTKELIELIGEAIGANPRLIAVSPNLLSLVAASLGKAAAFRRLMGSLQVDSSHIKQKLGWMPPFDTRQGLRATVADQNTNI